MGTRLFVSLILAGVFLTGVGAAQSGNVDISCFHCHALQVKEFETSVHYNRGISCTDCHGGDLSISGSIVSVNVMHTNFTGVPSRINSTNSCSKCHPESTEKYKNSIHWKELQRGVTIAATCTDCHGIHEIRAIVDNKSLSNHQNSPATCAKCHSNKEMMSAWYYGIKTDRMDTYKESFHWKALKNGYGIVATCADCHENHLTKSHTDPTSTTYPQNLPGTCGKANCHPGVKFDAEIAAGLVHDKESLHTGELVFNQSSLTPQMKAYFLGPFDLAYWIASFFKVLTAGVIGVFTGMVVLDCLSRFKLQRRW